MRNSTSGNTPNAVQDETVSNNAEQSSSKKFKQARLPFKVITTATTPTSSKATTTLSTTDKDPDSIKGYASTECRKRKLSYNMEDEGANVGIKDDNISKENVEILTAASKKKKSSVSNNSATIEPVVVVDDLDNDESSNEDIADSFVASAAEKREINLKTRKIAVKTKGKGAGTPQTSSAKKDKNGSAIKLQIKLPLSGGKKKRRKSGIHQFPQNSSENSLNKLTYELSSDDIEEIAGELNPQKRKKLSSESDETDKLETICTLHQKHKIDIISLGSESEQKDIEQPAKELPEINVLRSNKNPLRQCNKTRAVAKDKEPTKDPHSPSTSEKMLSSKNYTDKSGGNDVAIIVEISESSDEDEKRKNEDLQESVLSDIGADYETDNLGGKSVSVSSDISENSKLIPNNTKSLKDGKNPSSFSKNLTPNQTKLMEQRRKAREEKERRLQEEKIKKQQEKEERELIKKRDREEKEEHKRKERVEKEEQKRKEREEKERKRLAEIEAKNEEKRKKNEAKEEELRKKEEERKRKEQEKEEAELKKKKAAQAFSKFFVAKTPTNMQLKNEEDSNTGDRTKLLAFRPFQIKGDMKLAPICRKYFTAEEKHRLDDLLSNNNEAVVRETETETGDEEDKEIVRQPPLYNSQLYLSELRSGKILPGKWRRSSTESKDDVILVEDELERIGQEIVEDTPAYVREEMRVKFYKFHDNRRPPYYGTWRKKSSVVKARSPFSQDMKFFDYEVDSDDEWEEEEPGESLEDGSDDDKEKESEDDEYEVDNEWFVPHGHLSDEELQNEDELGMGDDNTREAQKVKLQLLQQEFAQEMKKKTEKIKPRLIGCIWTDINGNQPSECAKILWDTLEKKTMLLVDPPLINEPEADRSIEPNSPSGTTSSNTEKVTDKLKPISLSDSMIKDLTRLIHGNNHAKQFLINEYIAYVEKTEESVKNGCSRKPLKSSVRDKIEEIAEWQLVDAAASSILEMEQAADETDKKNKKVKRRLCWVVKQEMLDKMELSSLELKNSWKYILQPKSMKADKEVKVDETITTLSNGSTSTSVEASVKGKHSEIAHKTKFSKGLGTDKKTKEWRNNTNTASSTKISSTDNSNTETNINSPATPKEKKRVPLLMSVARGQQIPTPAKNKLISQFLQQNKKDSVKSSATSTRRSDAVTSSSTDDDIVILD